MTVLFLIEDLASVAIVADFGDNCVAIRFERGKPGVPTVERDFKVEETARKNAKKIVTVLGTRTFDVHGNDVRLEVVTKVKCVANVPGELWVAESVEDVPIGRKTLVKTKQTREFEHLMKVFWGRNTMYFGHGWDATKRCQKEASEDPVSEFFWNEHLLAGWKGVPKDVLDVFVAKAFVGYAGSRTVQLAGKEFVIAEISRRSKYFAGARFHRRGCNENGCAANTVETEQIVFCEKLVDGKNVMCVSSFVQVRGSVPLMWSQPPNMGAIPKICVSNDTELSEQVMCANFKRLIAEYGKNITVVSLLGPQKSEQGLLTEYKRCIETVPEFKDDKCITFNPLGINIMEKNFGNLEEIAAKTVPAQGFYLREGDAEPRKLQQGVFRVNCQDCLDRTTVSQTVNARYALNAQLTALGLLEDGKKFEEYDNVLGAFFDLVAGNADEISRQYCGTVSLGTAMLTKRESKMMFHWHMFWQLFFRHFISNFGDAVVQDAYDFFCGNHEAKQPPEIKRSLPGKRQTCFFVGWFTHMFTFVLSLVFLFRGEFSVCIMLLGMSIFSLLVIKHMCDKQGIKVSEHPRLILRRN